MRYFLIMCVLILLPIFGVYGQEGSVEGSQIKFTTLSYDLGNLEYKGDSKTVLFEFVNDGNAPLVIIRSSTSCSCLSVKIPRKPIAVGQTGVIEVTFDPTDRGAFNKSARIYSNSVDKQQTLFVKGMVK